MNVIKTISVLLPLLCVSLGHTVVRRGIPVSGSGHSSSAAGNDALVQLRDQQRVAEWSAADAVSGAVGRDYGNQVDVTAQFVSQFGVPVTKEGAQRLFDTIGSMQKASKITGALANSASSIRDAANNAASSSYQQALQAVNAGYGRSSGGYGGSGGGGRSRGSAYAWS